MVVMIYDEILKSDKLSRQAYSSHQIAILICVWFWFSICQTQSKPNKYWDVKLKSGHMGVSLLHLPSFLQCTMTVWKEQWLAVWLILLYDRLASVCEGLQCFRPLLHNNWVSYMSLFSDGIFPPLAQWLDQQYDILPLCHTFPSSTTTCQLPVIALCKDEGRMSSHTHTRVW